MKLLKDTLNNRTKNNLFGKWIFSGMMMAALVTGQGAAAGSEWSFDQPGFQTGQSIQLPGDTGTIPSAAAPVIVVQASSSSVILSPDNLPSALDGKKTVRLRYESTSGQHVYLRYYQFAQPSTVEIWDFQIYGWGYTGDRSAFCQRPGYGPPPYCQCRAADWVCNTGPVKKTITLDEGLAYRYSGGRENTFVNSTGVMYFQQQTNGLPKQWFFPGWK